MRLGKRNGAPLNRITIPHSPTVEAIMAEVAPKMAALDVPFARLRNGVSTSFHDR